MKNAKSLAPAKIKAARTSSKGLHQKTRQLDTLVRLMTHETGKSVRFEIAAEQGSKVYVAGTFNNWDPVTHPLTTEQGEGVFKATLNLPAGTHEYRFVVNGVWQMDNKNQDSAPNGHGTRNSVVHV
jgi:1,4-alpha-glucan branching enzyme